MTTDETATQRDAPGAFSEEMIEALAPDELAVFPLADAGANADHVYNWAADWDAHDLADADWAARALRRANARRKHLRDTVQREIDRLNAWADEQCQPRTVSDDTAWLEQVLERFHAAQIAKNEKRHKTIELPCGVTLASQAGKISVHIEDETALVEWCEEHPDAAQGCVEYPSPRIVKATVTQRFGGKVDPAAGEYDAYVGPNGGDDAGEKVPGVTLVRGPRTYHPRGVS